MAKPWVSGGAASLLPNVASPDQPMSNNPEWRDILASSVEAAASLELSHVPDEIVAHSGRVVADTVGVIVAGARSPEIQALAGALDCPGDATVLTPVRRRAAPDAAAFLNATAGTFIELDEGMRPTGHPAMHVVPPALAVAESTRASGSDLLQAVLAGYELTSRLFMAFRLTYPVHPHGHFGGIGAALAVALLEGSDPLQATRIAGTTPLLSVWEPCFEGATARNTYTGWAAEIGVRSSSLARAGFTGSTASLASSFGQIAGRLIDATALDAPLNYQRLGITHNYFKRHSACALSHAAIDAIQAGTNPPADQIDDVLVETVSNNLKLDRQPHDNALSGRFSLQYAVATALVLGRTDVEAFHYRPDVAEFARRVHVRLADDLEARWPEAAAARVTIHAAGQSFTRQVDNPHGHHSQPLTPEELQDKFHALVDAPQAAIWWNRLTHLSEVADCGDLLVGAAA
jgi:2-methylcitrate dehydratase PrpD